MTGRPAAQVAEDDLRSFGMRRCMRFYSALFVVLVWVAATQLVRVSGSKQVDEASRTITVAAIILLWILVAVEVASGIVMTRIATVRARGPETGIWRLATGPFPSWVAAASFATASLVIGLSIPWQV